MSTGGTSSRPSGRQRSETPRRPRAGGRATAGVPPWGYRVPLDRPIEHAEAGPYAGAAHYTGSADDLAARMAKHGTSEGARLLQVQKERGGSWHIARTWPGGKYEERAIK